MYWSYNHRDNSAKLLAELYRCISQLVIWNGVAIVFSLHWNNGHNPVIQSSPTARHVCQRSARKLLNPNQLCRISDWHILGHTLIVTAKLGCTLSPVWTRQIRSLKGTAGDRYWTKKWPTLLCVHYQNTRLCFHHVPLVLIWCRGEVGML